jgi:phosphoglycolate phosphatase-like HAD superfamily hydrolase
MIVFDVDGTLIGGENTDWKCFDKAFVEAAGFSLTSDFFFSLNEVTARAIVHQALDDATHQEKQAIEAKTRRGYIDRLERVLRDNSDAFPPISGAVSLILDLKNRGVPIAIATGDWKESSILKLSAAGIPFQDIPMTTSSEHYGRADIIASAVQKAGGVLRDSVYVGDGHWDLLAARTLGIPFIGCGSKLERLRQYGARYVLDRLDIDEFWRTIERIGSSTKTKL